MLYRQSAYHHPENIPIFLASLPRIVWYEDYFDFIPWASSSTVGAVPMKGTSPSARDSIAQSSFCMLSAWPDKKLADGAGRFETISAIERRQSS